MSVDFFKHVDFENQRPKAGSVLISEPFLFDPYFKRTVIYLTEHNKDGSIGFILNKPVNLTLNEVLSGFPETQSPVYFGGPVNQNNLFYLHTYGQILEGSREVKDGLFWGGDFELLKKLIITGEIDPEKIRFFAGYSGWGKGQLSRELKEKAWIVSKVSSDDVMNGKDRQFWNDILRKKGAQYEIMSNFPEDPTLN